MQKTLQIATVGSDTEKVVVGVRNIPTHKLALICLPDDEKGVNAFAIDLERTLKLTTEVHPIEGSIVEGVIDSISNIIDENRLYDETVINVAGGHKVLTCAAVSAAFINGVKAYHLDNDLPVMLPVLRLSYHRILSDTKISILKAILDSDSSVESLSELSEKSGYGKPLLSYHINGDDETQGLEALGLVKLKRHTHGRLRVILTTLGRIVIRGL